MRQFYFCYFIVAAAVVVVVQDILSSMFTFLKRSKSRGRDNKNTWVRGGYS